MKIDRIVEAKNVASVYVNYTGQLQIEVDGGSININTDQVGLRRLASAINDKIKRQDIEAAEDLAADVKKAIAESEESECCEDSTGCCQSES
tara:strand:+ start:1044 stop:1319 length:276 start_codon:yes stop_codon:yes gene_type:complete